MECKILLCLLMAFCTIKLSRANESMELFIELKKEIARSKTLAQALTSNVGRIKLNLQMTINSKLRVLLQQNGDIINALIETVQQLIRKDANAIKPKVKFPNAVERCVSSANQKLKAIDESHTKKLTACRDNAKQIADNHLHVLHAAQATGKQHITQLDNIMPNCQARNEFKALNCIRVLLRNINRLIHEYESNVSTLEKDAERGMNIATMSQNTCNSDVISAARKRINNVKDEASQCLQRA